MLVFSTSNLVYLQCNERILMHRNITTACKRSLYFITRSDLSDFKGPVLGTLKTSLYLPNSIQWIVRFMHECVAAATFVKLCRDFSVTSLEQKVL